MFKMPDLTKLNIKKNISDKVNKVRDLSKSVDTRNLVVKWAFYSHLLFFVLELGLIRSTHN